VFPSWLILALLVLTLVVTSVLTTRKGFNMRLKEQRLMVELPEPSPSDTPPHSDTEGRGFSTKDHGQLEQGQAPEASSATSSMNSLSFSGVELEDKSAIDWNARDVIDLFGNAPRKCHRNRASD
jgi:hypothetical protein